MRFEIASDKNNIYVDNGDLMEWISCLIKMNVVESRVHYCSAPDKSESLNSESSDSSQSST